jgi:hypothetical protein
MWKRKRKMVPLRGLEPPDLLLTLQVLCQLSYNGVMNFRDAKSLGSSYVALVRFAL